MKLTEFDIQISKENVCRLIQADPDSNVYQEIMAALQEMLPTAYEKLKPTALLEFGDFETYAGMIEEEGIEEALYGITTVGEEMGSPGENPADLPQSGLCESGQHADRGKRGTGGRRGFCKSPVYCQ